ncbi:hypothetical protein BDN72DRAFT_855703 [Pluteus cervinus]|uniref:Uncharacterized protein n=1 Tax=Pluteus cervinus TaxID=181527 RepID=A0ACD3B351_9AGAR|nr:hypothetical protein BDN72DRAFT_855703 [Pluteus cervinus]
MAKHMAQNPSAFRLERESTTPTGKHGTFYRDILAFIVVLIQRSSFWKTTVRHKRWSNCWNTGRSSLESGTVPVDELGDAHWAYCIQFELCSRWLNLNNSAVSETPGWHGVGGSKIMDSSATITPLGVLDYGVEWKKRIDRPSRREANPEGRDRQEPVVPEGLISSSLGFRPSIVRYPKKRTDELVQLSHSRKDCMNAKHSLESSHLLFPFLGPITPSSKPFSFPPTFNILNRQIRLELLVNRLHLLRHQLGGNCEVVAFEVVWIGASNHRNLQVINPEGGILLFLSLGLSLSPGIRRGAIVQLIRMIIPWATLSAQQQPWAAIRTGVSLAEKSSDQGNTLLYAIFAVDLSSRQVLAPIRSHVVSSNAVRSKYEFIHQPPRLNVESKTRSFLLQPEAKPFPFKLYEGDKSEMDDRKTVKTDRKGRFGTPELDSLAVTLAQSRRAEIYGHSTLPSLIASKRWTPEVSLGYLSAGSMVEVH